MYTKIYSEVIIFNLGGNEYNRNIKLYFLSLLNNNAFYDEKLSLINFWCDRICYLRRVIETNQGQKGHIPERLNSVKAHTRKTKNDLWSITSNHMIHRLLMLFYLYCMSVYFSFWLIAKVSTILSTSVASPYL